MKNRIIISAIALPLLFFIIRLDFYYSSTFFIFIFVLSLFSANEFFLMLKNIFPTIIRREDRFVFFLLPSLILISHYLLLNIFRLDFKTIMVITFSILMVMIIVASVLRTGKRFTIFILFIFSFIYTGYFPLFIYLVRRLDSGYSHVYLLFSLCWLSDAASYFVGKYFGKRKGIIKWSPNKTIEGLIGGFIFTLVSALWIKPVFMNLHLSYLNAFIIATLIGFTAPGGDILESWMKRKAGIKDSSGLFLQMGGVLDIFDSILLTSPLYYIMVVYLLRIG